MLTETGCLPCSDDKYSYPASFDCTPRAPCTAADYHAVYTECSEGKRDMSYEFLQVSIKAGIARVLLNHPPVNVLSVRMQAPDVGCVPSGSSADPIDDRRRARIERRSAHVLVPPVRRREDLPTNEGLVQHDARLSREHCRRAHNGPERDQSTEGHFGYAYPRIVPAATLVRYAIGSSGNRKDV